MYLGSHISLNRQCGYLRGVVRESMENGADTFMIFTGPPQNKTRLPISQFNLQEAREMAEANGIHFSKAVVHAPYILNLATNKEENIEFNIAHMVLEMQRTQEMGIPYIVLHPGYHVDQTEEEGLRSLSSHLNEVLERTRNLDVVICLETMAGKKNQLGSSLEQLSRIMEGCGWNDRLGICIDIVHMHDAGYDVSKKEEILNRVEELMGMDRIRVLHVGDSRNPRGSRKDVHANFNYGHIGFDVALEWIYDPRFKETPIIIETPFWIYEEKGTKKSMSPYRHEIGMIRRREFRSIPEGYRPR